MSHYKHLTRFEREKLLYFLALGDSVTKIAKALGRSKSTISRELRRNSGKDGYLPVNAEAKYRKRRKKCRRKKLLEDAGLYALVQDKFLNHHWSPEQIAGRLRLENSAYRISCNTIYRAIYSGMFDTPAQRRSTGNRGAKRKLRHRGKPRHSKNYKENRGGLKITHSIAERPAAANERTRFGDWEADTVLGKLGGACLVTLVDRKSRLLVCRKLRQKNGKELAEVVTAALQAHPAETITTDRGSEFLYHAQITEGLGGIQFYFALPQHPWQRGTNENTNGLLREFFPKGSNLTNISPEFIQTVEDELNLRPRKILGFKTPAEVHFSLSLHLT